MSTAIKTLPTGMPRIVEVMLDRVMTEPAAFFREGYARYFTSQYLIWLDRVTMVRERLAFRVAFARPTLPVDLLSLVWSFMGTPRDFPKKLEEKPAKRARR